MLQIFIGSLWFRVEVATCGFYLFGKQVVSRKNLDIRTRGTRVGHSNQTDISDKLMTPTRGCEF